MNWIDYTLIGIYFVTVLPVFIQAFRNFSVYKKTSSLTHQGRLISIIIPARNEEANIEKVVSSVLATDYPNIEVVIGNDHSEDATEKIVNRLINTDERVKLVNTPELLAGWGGKMHTCWHAGKAAKGEWLLFIDADVQLSPDAIERMVGEAEQRKVPFLSGFPKETTGTLGEKLLIPMIFFVLLGFLSIRRMRASVNPAYSASCGQVMLMDTKIYRDIGGHEAIKQSCHDGLDMPRLFRKKGFMADLVDLSDIIECRMYHSGWDTIVGLEKNAKFGLARPPLIFVFTFLLIVGQVVPWILLFVADLSTLQVIMCIKMGLMGYLVRFLHCTQHACSWLGAMLHPIGVLALMSIQWVAFIKALFGIKSSWKGRAID